MASAIRADQDKILALGVLDPIFEMAFKSSPYAAAPSSIISVSQMQSITAASLPKIRADLAASKPASITETEAFLSLSSKDHQSRLIICHKADSSAPAPLVILFHGGGHCIGYPEHCLLLARQIALTQNAVVVCPSYGLAPQHPFPSSINDSWDVVQALATELSAEASASALLPIHTDPSLGFIVGGESAGANLAASIAHLGRDKNLFPPLTGQFLSAGTFISPSHVPAKYASRYLSFEQNALAPIYPSLYSAFQESFRPDHSSALYASFDQHDERDEEGEVAAGHRDLPPAYFQVCGADIRRDDGLIYESVLREECGVKTRCDVYPGLPHVWWGTFPQLESSQRRMRDSVEGLAWLLSLTQS